MQKYIDLAKRIIKDPEKNWLPELEENNLKSFSPIYSLNTTLFKCNLIVAFLIFSYDPDSQLLNIRKDRLENKEEIIDYLNLDLEDELIQEIFNNNNEIFNDAVLFYLEKLTTWEWPTIYTLLEYHSSMMRFANQKTETEKTIEKMNKEGEVKALTQEYDMDTVAKTNKAKGELIEQAILSRERADKLLDHIKKEHVNTDNATQADFNFSFTDTAKKKVDIYSWKSFIQQRNERKKEAI